MNIVYATDDNGALGTGVSIVSLMENLPPGVHVDIYIMTGGLSSSDLYGPFPFPATGLQSPFALH